MHSQIEIGYQVFVAGNPEDIGAVRYIAPERREITVYVENSGEFVVHADAILDVADEKVVLDGDRLDPVLRAAIGRAHEAEDPNF